MLLKGTGREVPSNIHNSGTVDTGEAPAHRQVARLASFPQIVSPLLISRHRALGKMDC